MLKNNQRKQSLSPKNYSAFQRRDSEKGLAIFSTSKEEKQTYKERVTENKEIKSRMNNLDNTNEAKRKYQVS